MRTGGTRDTRTDPQGLWDYHQLNMKWNMSKSIQNKFENSSRQDY